MEQRGKALEALQAERIEEFGLLTNIPGTPEHAEQQQRRAKALEQVSGQLSRERKERGHDRGGHGLLFVLHLCSYSAMIEAWK